MKFDRNTVIGFVVLALLFFGYFYFNRQGQLASLQEEAEKNRKDSIENARKNPVPAATSADTTDSKDTGSRSANSAHVREGLEGGRADCFWHGCRRVSAWTKLAGVCVYD